MSTGKKAAIVAGVVIVTAHMDTPHAEELP
jgi:hypothetical protein